MAVAFASPQISPVLAQQGGVQSGGGNRDNTASHERRGSEGAATDRSGSREQRGRSERASAGGGGSVKSQTTLGVRTRHTTLRNRTQTRVGVSVGSRDHDVILKRKRIRHVAVQEPPQRTVLKKKRVRTRLVAEEPVHRTVMIKKRHRSVAISGETRTTIRSGNVRSRDVTVGSSSSVSHNRGSSVRIRSESGKAGSETSGRSGHPSGVQSNGQSGSGSGGSGSAGR